MSESILKMFILDVLRYDVEQPSSIVTLLNNNGIGWREYSTRDFTLGDVLPILSILEAEAHIRRFVLVPEAPVIMPADSRPQIHVEPEVSWYGITDTGRELIENWDPPATPFRLDDLT